MDKGILAIITMRKDVVGGGSPIFGVETSEQLEQLSFTLEKILDAMVHQLTEETYIIVRHHE